MVRKRLLNFSHFKMKTLQHRIAGAALTLALGLTFLFSASQAQAAADPAATGGATVESANGRATLFRADGSRERVTVGMKIGEGDKLITGLGTVGLNLGSHGLVRVQSRSEVTLEELKRNAGGEAGKDTTIFNLTKGGLLGDVKKVSANSDYKVKTAKGVAGIRGTKYLILAVGVFKCANGSLVVTMFAINPQTGQPKVFTVTPGTKLDSTKVVQEVTNMTPGEAATVVNLVDTPPGPVTPVVIVINQAPTEVFISPTAGDNNRLFQYIDEGDIGGDD